jgi:hypothetical protein
MGTFKDSTAAGLKVARPASDPADVVRKGEFDAALALRPTAEQISALITAAVHAAVTKADTNSVAITLTGQQVSADLRVSYGLKINPSGVLCDFGTGENQVPRGNHTHDDLHAAATGSATTTATVSTDSTQAISVSVKIDPAGNLTVGENGIGVNSSAFAAADHTHTTASTTEPGFMSAADKAKLDNLSITGLTFATSASIAFDATGGTVTAEFVPGAGLKLNVDGVPEVDFTAVAAIAHTHNDATNAADGLMTKEQVQALEAHLFSYIGYADDVVDGVAVNFSTTYDTNKTYMSVLQSATAIAAPAASDFGTVCPWILI